MVSDGNSGRIERRDPRFDALISSDAALEVVAGFSEREDPHWLESPTWDRRNGSVLFSDVKANAIWRWGRDRGVTLFMQPSGYTGEEPFAGQEPGANGLAFDIDGHLIICEHGDRRVCRLEADGSKTVLADCYDGRRLNSPNDLVCRSDGAIYFTDPPFGLPRQFNDPGRELPFSGVYRLSKEGDLKLLLDELRAPNGIAFSPDEKTLYLADGDPNRSAWLAYPIREDDTLGEGRLLLDVTGASGFGGPTALRSTTSETFLPRAAKQFSSSLRTERISALSTWERLRLTSSGVRTDRHYSSRPRNAFCAYVSTLGAAGHDHAIGCLALLDIRKIDHQVYLIYSASRLFRLINLLKSPGIHRRLGYESHLFQKQSLVTILSQKNDRY